MIPSIFNHLSTQIDKMEVWLAWRLTFSFTMELTQIRRELLDIHVFKRNKISLVQISKNCNLDDYFPKSHFPLYSIINWKIVYWKLAQLSFNFTMLPPQTRKHHLDIHMFKSNKLYWSWIQIIQLLIVIFPSDDSLYI